MSEANEKNEERVRPSYPSIIPSHKALAKEDSKGRWARIHEQKRLAAYLRGDKFFAHGRVPALPIGFRPKMWPVWE